MITTPPSPGPVGPRDRRRTAARLPWVLLLALSPVLFACSGDAPTDPGGSGDGDADASLNCALNTEWLADGGVGRGGIPHLTNPKLVSAGHEEAGYLVDDSRVMGIVVDGQPVAVPLQILWWHEIVNLDRGSASVAVTYCPLTGSGLVFRRDVVGGEEFVVSGLLYYNNLIMSAGAEGETLYSQMFRTAVCGPELANDLDPVPVIEIAWSAWKELHPDTRVVSRETGFQRNYNSYPYGRYPELTNERTLFPVPEIDPRRPPKERVLGIPEEEGVRGVALPFGELEELGDRAVVEVEVDGRDVVVFWSDRARAAMAFRPGLAGSDGGRRLHFRVRDGAFVDEETGTTWRLDGRATDGELAGERLEPVDSSYVAFWFAWALFQPGTEVWEDGQAR